MAVSLSRRLGVTVRRAKDFIIDFYRAFPDLRRWFDRVVLAARIGRHLETPLGWRRKWHRCDGESAMRAFMVQGTTANVMQHAVVQLDRAGLELIGTVHDAIIAEAPVEDAEAAAKQISCAIRNASAVVLNGFELRSKATIVRGSSGWPLKGRALNTWERVRAAALVARELVDTSAQ
jgi:DNA polymerase I-like protein with 3'-5' exonuclease and polymerase domains